MICSFFGHKDTPPSVFMTIKEVTEQLIVLKKADCFMVGNQGAFDNMVLKALRELKTEYPHIRYNVVLAYMPFHNHENESIKFTETLLPEGIETVPKRFAISWRNRWMVQQSQIIICYVTHSWGGAAQFVDYAHRQRKEVINIAEK